MLNKSKRLQQLDLEISSTCQAYCPVCIRTWRQGELKKFKQTYTPVAEVQRIVGDLAKQLQKVTFCGNWGDPMANKDIVPICEWFKSQNPNIVIDIATNGGIGTAIQYAQLGKMGVRIIFGFDGPDQETNELYRVNVNFNTAIKNAKVYCANLPKETPQWEGGGWQYLLFNENKHRLEDAIKLAIETGINKFFINEWPNPFSSLLHHTVDKGGDLIFTDRQKIDVWHMDKKTYHTLTPAYDMAEKVRELKEKYASDLFFY